MQGKYQTHVHVFYGAQMFQHNNVQHCEISDDNLHVRIVSRDGTESEFFGLPFMVIRDPERDEHGQVIQPPAKVHLV